MLDVVKKLNAYAETLHQHVHLFFVSKLCVAQWAKRVEVKRKYSNPYGKQYKNMKRGVDKFAAKVLSEDPISLLLIA